VSGEDTYTKFFNNAEETESYAAAPPKFMPGFFDMHRMACVLLKESVSDNAHILIHGAGGGLEIESFAKFNPNWTFLGVDPAAPMLKAARQRLTHFKNRVDLHHGFIFDAPDKKFEAATSILTLHFLEASERLRTITEIVRRLKPGAPFIAVHCSFPQSDSNIWLARHRSYSIAAGIEPALAEMGRADIENKLPVLNPQEDEAILRASGLENVTQFYSAFTWRGWIGYASHRAQ
jgi:tRNA (cmo5U34)-methyltransferase